MLTGILCDVVCLNFWFALSAMILLVGAKYTMRDLISDIYEKN